MKEVKYACIFILVFCLNFQVCFAAMDSTNFSIDKDVIGSFGDIASSSNFTLGDTGGEVGTGPLNSDNFKTDSGYWTEEGTFTIAISCTNSITLHSITGTGKSQWTGSENDAYCNIKTDNPDGYELTWQASTADMTTPSNDSIAAYTPADPLIPETWSIDTNASEWGAKLMSTSTVYDTKWGVDDTYTNGNWFNVDHLAPYSVVASTEPSGNLGDEEYLRFGTEIGASKHQPTGTYTVNVTVTVTAL